MLASIHYPHSDPVYAADERLSLTCEVMMLLPMSIAPFPVVSKSLP